MTNRHGRPLFDGSPKELLIRSLSFATTVNEVKEAYLRTAGSVLHADGIGFYQLSQEATELPVDVAANVDQEFLAQYESIGRLDDPVLKFVVRHQLPVDSSRIPQEEWMSSAAQSLLADQTFAHSLQAPVIKSGELIGTINFARVEASGEFSELDVAHARVVSAHVALALERANRFEYLEARLSVLEGSLDRSGQATIVCNLDGEAEFMTSRAREILGGSDNPLRMEIPTPVLSAIRKFAEQGKFADTQRVVDEAAGRQLLLKFHRFRHRNALVCFVYPHAEVRHSALPATGVLSPREQEIASLVARGLTTKEMAAEAFISENTIKQHLKRIFAKLNVASRAELIQLVWTLREDEAPRTAPRSTSSEAAAAWAE